MESDLQQAFDRWDELYKSGGSDPFWSDGCNLALVRNHIIYHKGKIKETMKPENYPAIYHRKTPAEVPRDYMARAEEIRINAKKTLESYKKDENYRFLLSQVSRLKPKDANETCIQNVIGYAAGLELAIASDDLISMRRHEKPERYISSFRECAKKVRELKPAENEQMSLFDIWQPEEYEEGGTNCGS